ncbi:hypothetical protein Asi03nite_34920 [Actinoplanes siamensis]|uniref:Uncharacterized protein n=1 Tax=Actinoplanes siamensis TaxID=1223317 RepID=A0A919N7Y9_9ACTN|nr:hypothetical protein Asi03nite_34920 [Actinoplanes siamensis]
MKWCGREVEAEAEGIVSLRAGGCPEDCHSCSRPALFASGTCRSLFPHVVTTHSWEGHWSALTVVREPGGEVCGGGIPGQGETVEQRAEFAAQPAELDPHEVPPNVLDPRPGTPLGDRTACAPAREPEPPRFSPGLPPPDVGAGRAGRVDGDPRRARGR